jgi:putative RNA 2'-phosphotransferase
MNDPRREVRISKFLSLVLRHRPERIGITLEPAGWVAVEDLLGALARHGFPVTREELGHVVAHNDKQRFAFSPGGERIRASQGHSVPVDLEYAPAVPPEILYHGTADRNLESIREKGLLKGQRHHVHLSPDRETALKVGRRYGRPVVLRIKAGEMQREGFEFFVSANGVWLTGHVPARYLEEE